MIPVLAALGARPLASRLPPAVATWLLAGSALALAVASSAMLGLLAMTAIDRVPLIDGLGHMSARIMAEDDPASLPVAIAAGAVLAAVAAAACRAVYRRGSALLAAGRQASRLPGAGDVVVTDDDRADAYTLPGWPCRIVITAGMLRALTHTERQVLLAHERAHAGRRHYVFTSLARLAAAANPLLRPVAAEVGFTVERWADEDAADVMGDRSLTARAIARAALATSAAPPARDATGALGILGGRLSMRGAGPVPRRVAALLRPAPRPSLVLLGAALLLVAVSGASALEAARNLHQLIELAQAGAIHR
ncbi:MAG TPA: M56 family metallopeptidase [Trebonia sp.]|nr:M56 family metallopeptidase [Trebonia sp.]